MTVDNIKICLLDRGKSTLRKRVLRAARLIAFAVALMTLGGWFGGSSCAAPVKEKSRENQEQRLFDEAQLIPEGEIESITEGILHARKKTGMDVVIVTAYNDGVRSAEEYADDYYDYGGFGTGKNHSGVLYLLYMDAPGQRGGECWISTTGEMIRILTDQRIDRMMNNVAGSLRTEEYGKSVEIFLNDIEYYVDKGIQSGQYIYDRDTGEISYYKSIRWHEGVVALLVPAFIASSVCLGIKNRYAMKVSERDIANGLLAYRSESNFRFEGLEDRFINKYVTSVPIQRVSSHSSGRGGGQSSRRSSTHRSSSGRSHGGGGRKF